MSQDLDLSSYSCCHEDCPDYGKRDAGNIVLKERYGKNNRALLKCRTCGHCFSESRGTAFFGLSTPQDEVLRVLAMLPEKGSIRGLARATGHDKNTICRWLDIAGKHCKEVTDYFFQDLDLTQVQVDEIWSYVKKKDKNLTDDDPDDYGTVYSNTIIKTNTRLFICHHEGNRTIEDATALFSDLEQRRSTESQIPIFISDEWDSFEEGLLNVYGVQMVPPYKGIGRKPKPRIIPPPNLKYVQIRKKKENNTVVGVVQRVVFGDEKDVLKSIHTDSNYKISTSYVEGLNRIIRNSLARFIRRGMNFSKQMKMHVRALDFFQAWYNFVKPHESLKVEIDQGNTKWKKRTPAMAEGLVDHIFTLKELLTFRVPVQ